MKLAVLIPSSDGRARLETQLAALAQSSLEAEAFEVIVLLRGVADGSISLLEMLQRRLAFRLEVKALPTATLGQALQRAIATTDADAVLLLEDDAIPAPETLARHLAFHAVHRRSVALGPLGFADGLQRPLLRPSWMSCSSNTSWARSLEMATEWLWPEAAILPELGWHLTQADATWRALPDAQVTHNQRNGAEYAHTMGYWVTRIAHQHDAQQRGTLIAQQLLKRTLLNPLGDALFGSNPNYRFERAFLQGSRKARRELEG